MILKMSWIMTMVLLKMTPRYGPVMGMVLFRLISDSPSSMATGSRQSKVSFFGKEDS